MTISELKILIDLNENQINDILINYCARCRYGDFFIDDNGSCHLLDKYGNELDISNVKCLYEVMISKNIKKIIIPNSVKDIRNFAFSYCKSLTSISIPDSVKEIGDYAFACCESLESILIPDSVERIGPSAFYECTALKEVIFDGKTIEEVKNMENYPFEIEDKSIIKCS